MSILKPSKHNPKAPKEKVLVWVLVLHSLSFFFWFSLAISSHLFSMAKRLIPSLNRVLIEKIVPPSKTNSGILLPEKTSKVSNSQCFISFFLLKKNCSCFWLMRMFFGEEKSPTLNVSSFPLFVLWFLLENEMGSVSFPFFFVLWLWLV